MLLNLEVADVTRSLQSQNGLRHGDYNRYRRFCTRKLHRMKAALGIPSGRHRYKSVPIPDAINSAKFVELLLVQSERSWAYGITLKSEYALGEAKAPGRIRHRYVHKYHRAAHWSGKLVELATRTCDARTVREAEAYHAWMSGLALTESGQYGKAIEQIEASIEKYTRLVQDSLDVVFPGASKAYRHRMTDLEPLLRICKYKLRVGDITAAEPISPKSVADFESAHDSISEAGEVDFSSDEVSCSDEEMRPKPKTTVLGALGGWWNKA